MISNIIKNLNADNFFNNMNPETTEGFKDSVIVWGIAIFGILFVIMFLSFFKGRLL